MPNGPFLEAFEKATPIVAGPVVPIETVEAVAEVAEVEEAVAAADPEPVEIVLGPKAKGRKPKASK